MTDWTNSAAKTYEIKQMDTAGALLASVTVEASSGEAAAKQLADVVDGADRIVVCLNGASINEMGVNYWKKRVRRRQK